MTKISGNRRQLSNILVIFTVLIILMVSTVGTYAAARRLRGVQRAVSDLTTRVLSSEESRLGAEEYRYLLVLLENPSFRESFTLSLNTNPGFSHSNAVELLRRLVDENRSFPGTTPPPVMLHFYRTVMNYTESQLRQLESIQLLVGSFSVIFSVVILALILRNRGHERLALSLKRLNRQHLEETEELRAGIAAEIHDKVIQDLALMKISLETGTPDPARTAAGIEGSIQDLRRLISRVQPWDTMRVGLIFSIEMMCKNYARDGKLRILKTLPMEEQLRMSVRAKLHVLRILQELLSNAVRHSGASLVQLTMKAEKYELFISLIDNGAGFDPGAAQSKDSFGIVSLTERIENLGGSSSIDSRKSAGTRFRIHIPMESSDG
jgi:signal transduction histidine kinase